MGFLPFVSSSSFPRPNTKLRSNSGYDFGYLLKILTCEPLPANETDFFHLLSFWFPCIYDIKHVVRSVKTLRGGLQEIAESLGVSQPWHDCELELMLLPIGSADRTPTSGRI